MCLPSVNRFSHQTGLSLLVHGPLQWRYHPTLNDTAVQCLISKQGLDWPMAAVACGTCLHGDLRPPGPNQAGPVHVACTNIWARTVCSSTVSAVTNFCYPQFHLFACWQATPSQHPNKPRPRTTRQPHVRTIVASPCRHILAGLSILPRRSTSRPTDYRTLPPSQFPQTFATPTTDRSHTTLLLYVRDSYLLLLVCQLGPGTKLPVMLAQAFSGVCQPSTRLPC